MNIASFQESSVGHNTLTKNKRRIGDKYELLAHQYLTRQGLSLIEKNFSTNGGELDLIMKDLDCIIFVEVRYRKSKSFGHAAETVTASKIKKNRESR